MENSEELQSEIAQKMSLDQVRYSQVWEDHLLLEEGRYRLSYAPSWRGAVYEQLPKHREQPQLPFGQTE